MGDVVRQGVREIVSENALVEALRLPLAGL
jgi:hypothetical protein